MEEEYNDIPVFYCTECLSLNIKTISEDSGLDYCDDCGSTDIEKVHIDEWRRMYRERYGFDFLTKNINKDGREKQTYL